MQTNNSWCTYIGWAILCLTASFIVFFPALYVGFLSDDFHMRALSATQDLSILQYFTTNLEGANIGSSYGPIFRLWWRGMYMLFGENPFAYHVFLLVLHATAAYLVGLFSYFLTKKKPLAMVVSVLFLVLQSRAEPVVWVASFPHVFVTVCVLGASIAWLIYLQSKKKVGWYLASLFIWAVALFTKEIAVVVPAIWLLLTLVQTKSWRKKLLQSISLLTLPAVIVFLYLWLRAGATGLLTGYYANTAGVSLSTMIQSVFDVLVGMWLPVDVRRTLVQWFMTHPVAVLLMIGALILYLKQTKQKNAALLFGMALITLIPFTQVSLHPFTQEGERYTYLVSAFMVPFIVFLFAHLFKKRAVFIFAIACIITVQLYWLVPKQLVWIEASKKTTQIITSAHSLSLLPTDHIVLIGFPDNYFGAQMLRNAAGVALGLSVQERIPQYIEYRANALIFSEIREEGGRIILDTRHQSIQENLPTSNITGFPVWQGDYTSSSITNFYALGNRGKNIEISLKKAEIEHDILSDGKDFVLLFVDNLKLKELFRLSSH